MASKHVLNTSGDELDFLLFGIVCQEDQYRMSALINDALGTDLSLASFIPFNLKNGRSFSFSLFTFDDEDLGISYELIPNSSNFEEPQAAGTASEGLFAGQDVDETARLIKELPKTDYFLILKGEDLHHYQYKVSDLLKTIEEVIQVQLIRPTDLPSRRNLIF